MLSIYKLTLRQLSGWARLGILLVLAAMPVTITVLMLRDSSGGSSMLEFESVILGVMLLGSIAPLVVLAIAAAAFGSEIEDRTLANLTISPIPRWQIALPKLLAIITIAGPIITLAALVMGHIAFLADARATIAVTVAAFVGVAMYASLFMWLGLVSLQAMGIGLLYVVLWEGFFSEFVAGVRLLSIRYYAIALMHAMDERRFASSNHMGTTAAIIVAVLVIGGFLWLSIRRLRRMDVP